MRREVLGRKKLSKVDKSEKVEYAKTPLILTLLFYIPLTLLSWWFKKMGCSDQPAISSAWHSGGSGEDLDSVYPGGPADSLDSADSVETLKAEADQDGEENNIGDDITRGLSGIPFNPLAIIIPANHEKIMGWRRS